MKLILSAVINLSTQNVLQTKALHFLQKPNLKHIFIVEKFTVNNK